MSSVNYGQSRHETSSEKLTKSALYIFVFLSFICALVAVSPYLPGPGLDNSWRHALNVAVDKDLIIGKDIVFTFGPYASVYTKTYHPSTDFRALMGGLYLALTYAGLMIYIFRETVWSGLILTLIAIVAINFSMDAIFLSYPFAALIAASKMTEDKVRRDHSSTLILLCLFLLPFGFLPLIKGSNLLACVGTGAILLALCLASKWWKGAIALCSVGLFSPIFFWLLTGQNLFDLITYFINLLTVSSGYSDALVLFGPPGETRLYLLGIAVTLIAIAITGRNGMAQRAALLFGLALVAFVGFKAGFVRHDRHASISASVLLLTTVYAYGLASFRIHKIPAFAVCIPVAMAGFFLIVNSHRSYTFGDVVLNGATKYTSASTGLMQRMGMGDSLTSQYNLRLLKLSEQANLPKLEGTSDLYNFEQHHMLSAENDWSPRPMFQSVTAYTGELVLMNRDHLLSPDAPDNIFFRVAAIDGRLPSMPDGASWPVILNRYHPVDKVSDYAILKKHPNPRDVKFTPLSSDTFKFGETIQIPASDQIVFAKISISKTLVGSIRSFLYKPNRMKAFFSTESGRVIRQGYVIPGMIEEGMIVSPLVTSTDQFLRLYSPSLLETSRLASQFKIENEVKNTAWKNEIRVEFFEFSAHPAGGGNADITSFAKPEPLATDIAVVSTSACETAIGLHDNQRISGKSRHLQSGNILRLQGWSIIGERQTGHAPDKMVPVMTDANGQHFGLPVRVMDRGTLAKRFDNPAVTEAGFQIEVDLSGMSGEYTFQIGELKRNQLTLCNGSDYTIKRLN